jgi:hypothetical protein
MKTVTRLLALLLCFGAMHLSAQNKRLTYCNPPEFGLRLYTI